MHDTSFNPYRAWSAESFWLIWSHCSRYKVLWFLSPVPWSQDCNIPNPDCSIPNVYILLSDDELTNSLYGQLLLLQRQIVLTKTVIHSVHIEKWNATRENSTYCIIISTVSKNWGGLSSPPFVCVYQQCLSLRNIPVAWELYPKQTPRYLHDFQYSIQICSVGLNHSSFTRWYFKKETASAWNWNDTQVSLTYLWTFCDHYAKDKLKCTQPPDKKSNWESNKRIWSCRKKMWAKDRVQIKDRSWRKARQEINNFLKTSCESPAV